MILPTTLLKDGVCVMTSFNAEEEESIVRF